MDSAVLCKIHVMYVVHICLNMTYLCCIWNVGDVMHTVHQTGKLYIFSVPEWGNSILYF